jgi:8-oxo-dGTP pyrophosphatase MutT (NUDIX family)
MDNPLLKKLLKNLKKQQGLLSKDKYFNSAVLITLILANDEYHFLFEKRSAGIRQGGEVSFPGGEFDKSIDFNFQDTAVRETVEELGLDKDKIEVVGKMDILVAPMGVTVDPFIGVLHINGLDELKIDTLEVERIFTIPVSYFCKNKPSEYFVKLEVHPSKRDNKGEFVELLPVKKLKLPERYSKPWKGRKHRVLVYETNEGTVWGITAELVYEFCKLLSDD